MNKEATTEDLIPAPQPPEWLHASDLIKNQPYGVSDVPLESPNVTGTTTSTNKIIRTAGQTVYIQHYEQAVTVFNVKPNTPKIKKTATPVRRPDSVKRSARRVKDLSLENYPLKPKSWGMPCFLTTTYADPVRGNPKNRKQQIADNNAFIRKLRSRYGNKIKLIGVFELQDGHRLKDKTKKARMTIQSHWLVFNLPYNEWQDLKVMWGLGTVHISRLKFDYRSARSASARVSNYITKTAKYMSKDLGVTSKAGEKSYFVSEGLEQPHTFLRWEEVDTLLTHIYQNNYECSNRSELKYNPHFQAWCVYEEWNPPNT
jgi:hypothetical protein